MCFLTPQCTWAGTVIRVSPPWDPTQRPPCNTCSARTARTPCRYVKRHGPAWHAVFPRLPSHRVRFPQPRATRVLHPPARRSSLHWLKPATYRAGTRKSSSAGGREFQMLVRAVFLRVWNLKKKKTDEQSCFRAKLTGFRLAHVPWCLSASPGAAAAAAARWKGTGHQLLHRPALRCRLSAIPSHCRRLMSTLYSSSRKN